MILGIKIAQVTARLNMLLEQWFLSHEIRLGVKEMAAATTAPLLGTIGTTALSRETPLGPQATLADDALYPLEPPWIMGVVIRKIEQLLHACQGIEVIAHAWPVRVKCPEAFGILRVHQWCVNEKKKLCTFDHLPGRDGIICTFLVTRCVIEHEKALDKAICFGLEDVNCTIYLCDEILCIEVSILVLPRFEHNTGLPAE